MFNHFFFDRPDGEQVLRDFLRQAPGEQVVLLMDPAFGGLVEVLAVTVKRIWDTWKDVNKGQLFLFFCWGGGGGGELTHPGLHIVMAVW